MAKYQTVGFDSEEAWIVGVQLPSPSEGGSQLMMPKRLWDRHPPRIKFDQILTIPGALKQAMDSGSPFLTEFTAAYLGVSGEFLAPYRVMRFGVIAPGSAPPRVA